MEPLLSKDDFIDYVAKRARYLKVDVKNILDTIVSVMEESVREHEPFKENESTKLLMRVRGFGSLYLQKIPERKGRYDGEILPVTTRTVFKLSEGIRHANKILVDKEDLDNIE